MPYARKVSDRCSPSAQAQETLTTPSQFGTCWSGALDESQIDSLLSQLSDVDSLTIMSPKSDDSHELDRRHTPTDSLMLKNQVFDEEGGPMTDESSDSGMVSRQLKPIRTRSSMGGSVTPVSSTPEVSPPKDRSVVGSGMSGRRNRSKPMSSSSPDHAMSSPGTHTPWWRADAEHNQKSSHDPRSMKCVHAQTGTPGVRPGDSSMDLDSPSHKRSPRGTYDLDQELAQEPSVEEQTQMLYACIQAMEAQLKRQGEQEPARGQQTLPSTSPCQPGASTVDRSTRAHAQEEVLVSAQVPQPGGCTGSNGGAVYASGPQAPWQGQQQNHPQMFAYYQVPLQYGFHGAASADNTRVPHTPNRKKSAGLKAASSHTRGSKRSNKSSRKSATPKSSRSKASPASAKGEGVRNESSGEIFVGSRATSSGEGQVQAQKDQTGNLSVSKPVLRKGQTAEVQKALNDAEPDEPVTGGCLGQFWGANRKVKKKNDMPRAPKITAPVIEAQKGDRLGVRLGCW